MAGWYINNSFENEKTESVVQLKCPIYREESPYENEYPNPIYLTDMYLTLFDNTIRIIGKKYLKHGPTTFKEFQFDKNKIQRVTTPTSSAPYQDSTKPDFLKAADLPILADLQTFNPTLEDQIKDLIVLFGIND